jgi:putative ABC transport system permease protein
MTVSTFIIRNAMRNKRRAMLSILSMAVSLFLLVTLLVALREITQPPEDIGATQRVAVRHKVSLGSPLPYRQREIIARIPGVAAVTPFTFFGGKFRGESGFSFAQFALDAEQLTNVFGEAKTPPDQLAAWQADRNSCIVGKLTMERYHLRVGERMQLAGTIWPCDLDLKIAGIYEGTPDDRNVFFHHKLLDESTGNTGRVGTWWVRAQSLEEAPLVIERINQRFANTSAEVKAETERAFQLSFVAMWANIKTLIGSICSVVVFTLLLVTSSTMSMAVRERFRELAVLKALGFQRRELFAFILAESFGLAMAGAVVGAGGAWLAFSRLSISQLTGGMFVAFEVTPRILGLAFLVAAVLGIVASLAPAISVARMSVVSGLKTLD